MAGLERGHLLRCGGSQGWLSGWLSGRTGALLTNREVAFDLSPNEGIFLPFRPRVST